MKTEARKKIFKEGEPEPLASTIEARRLLVLSDLESRYAQLRARLGADASDSPECELLRAQIELAKAEHDRAGALKFKSFVRRNREIFAGMEGKPGVQKRETDGRREYAPASETENRRYLVVNVGELDRLNKEGHSQSAGDAGLESLVRAASASAAVAGCDISVYRYGGNEYLIEFPEIAESDFALFEQALMDQKLDMGNFGDIEAPPLSVTRTSFAEVLDIMNSAALASPRNEEKDPYEAAAESVTVLTRFADYDLEREKFTTRVKRAIEKIEACRAGEISRDEARSFFDTYLKKSFYGTGVDSLERIEDLWRGGADPEDFDSAVGLMAAEAAKRRFADDRQFELYERHLSGGLMRDYLRAVAPREKEERPFAETFSANAKMARIPDPRYGTEGLRAMMRMKESIGARGNEWIEADKTFFEAEKAKRDWSTGLLERGQFYEDLNGRVKSGERTSLIFIDMGFLKYFNDAGRRAVGDAALVKAAEIMEEALMENDVEGRVYRYGGDEFTIMINGGKEEAEEIKEEIERLRAEAGRIPDLRSLREQGRAQDTVGDSRPDYMPMELVFDYGIADIVDVDRLMNDLGPEGIDSELSRGRRSYEDFKSDLLVKLADAAVARGKAVNRFRQLLSLMASPGYRDRGSPEHVRTEAVIAASRKAIFAGLGGEAALRFWAEGLEYEDPDVLDSQIERFVADRLEKMDDILSGERELIDKLVEVHAARNRLRSEVERLKKEAEMNGRLLKEDAKKIEELKQRLREADEARKELINVRESIAASAVDRKARK